MVRQIPRAAQGHLPTGSLGPTVVTLFAGAGDGIDLAGCQIDSANGVVLGVSEVQSVPQQLHALRVVERGSGIVAVHEVLFAGTDYPLNLSVQIGHDDAVVVGIRDEQPVARAVGEDLARESQR